MLKILEHRAQTFLHLALSSISVGFLIAYSQLLFIDRVCSACKLVLATAMNVI